MSYDMRNGEVEQLLDYPTPIPAVGTGGYAWDPGMTRMIMGNGHAYIDEQLMWFTRAKWEMIDVGLPLAYAPAWSPDGNLIAFIGSRQSGTPTRGPTYHLFLMDSDAKNIRVLSEGYEEAVGLGWSPDGRWLAFSGAPEGRWGLWLLDPGSGERRLSVEGAYDVPRWSPDGQRIVSVQFEPAGDPQNNRIVIIDVGPALQD
jgi:WD40 repeat protein